MPERLAAAGVQRREGTAVLPEEDEVVREYVGVVLRLPRVRVAPHGVRGPDVQGADEPLQAKARIDQEVSMGCPHGTASAMNGMLQPALGR